MKLMIKLFFLSLGFVGFSQQQLTLSDAIKFALENKADAVKAQLDVENSEYLISETRAQALPHVNVVSDLKFNPLLQQTALDFGGATQIIRMGRKWQANAAVSFEQELFNQSVFTGLKAARTTREFYLINAELTKEQLIEKVALSYYSVYKTKSQLKTILQTINNTDRIRGVISSLYDNGLAKKIDLDRTVVSLNNLKSVRNKLKNGLYLQESALKYLIGMDINQEIILPENTLEVNPNVFVSDSFSSESRTEVKLIRKQAQLLELNKKAIQAGAYPSLKLSGQYAYVGIGDKFPLFRGEPDIYWSDFASVGLRLTIPIFNGGVIRAKVNKAKIALKKLQADEKNTLLAFDLELQNAVTQLNNSLLTVNVQSDNVNLAKNVLSDIENNYKNGLTSLTDLLNAETSYSDAQNNYTNALIDYKLAEIKLIKAKGELQTLNPKIN